MQKSSLLRWDSTETIFSTGLPFYLASWCWYPAVTLSVTSSVCPNCYHSFKLLQSKTPTWSHLVFILKSCLSHFALVIVFCSTLFVPCVWRHKCVPCYVIAVDWMTKFLCFAAHCDVMFSRHFFLFFLAAVVTSSYWSTNMVFVWFMFCTGYFGDGVLAVYFVTQLSVTLYIVFSSFDNFLTCTP